MIYKLKIKNFLEDQLVNPDDKLLSLISSKVKFGNLTQKRKIKFEDIFKNAFLSVIENKKQLNNIEEEMGEKFKKSNEIKSKNINEKTKDIIEVNLSEKNDDFFTDKKILSLGIIGDKFEIKNSYNILEIIIDKIYEIEKELFSDEFLKNNKIFKLNSNEFIKVDLEEDDNRYYKKEQYNEGKSKVRYGKIKGTEIFYNKNLSRADIIRYVRKIINNSKGIKPEEIKITLKDVSK